MYAIIKDGGHQYRVEMGQRIRVQRRIIEAGKIITFKEVCLLSTKDDEAKIGKHDVIGDQLSIAARDAEARKNVRNGGTKPFRIHAHRVGRGGRIRSHQRASSSLVYQDGRIG